jgi:hypothetical protein
MKMEHIDVPKRRHIKFTHRGITRKKEYNKNRAAHFLLGSVLKLEAACSQYQAMSKRIILK